MNHLFITADLFRNRLDQMIDLRHPLSVLVNRIPWQEIEASLAHLFARKVTAGKRIQDLDLLGATEVIAGAGFSKAVLQRLPTRDEDLIQRWGETPTWYTFLATDTLKTAGIATQPNWSSSANCWAKRMC